MKDYKLHVSDGFKDIYGLEMLIKRELENRVLDTFNDFGYELIKTPGIEYLDVYTHDGLQKPDLYNLINRQGEVLALRNDMTASVARFVCTNTSITDSTLKYCYSDDTYRYPRAYQGKDHQFLQAGVELIGDNSFEADCQMIHLASSVLNRCNCKSFTINLGSASFLKTLFNDFRISDALQKDIMSTIQDKDYVTLREILYKNLDNEKAEFIIDLMMRGGKLKYIENLMKKLSDTESYKKLEYLRKVYLSLRELGIDNIIFDFSIYSYAEYYTGIIFNIYIDSVTKFVVSGGRSDSLFKNYGKDLPDIGFGVDLDILTDYCLNNSLIEFKKEKYLSYQKGDLFVKALKNDDEFRKNGIAVSHVNFNCLDCAMEYAKKHGFTKVIEYTENGFNLKEVM